MITGKSKQILIAPLDWGLGHTTRCVPVISHIIGLGHVPVVACNTSQRSFIEETFGKIDIIHLDGYNVSYSRWNKWAQAGLLAQLPRIRRIIRNEHDWLQSLNKERHIDGVISDNRYGLWHPGIPSVIITHQLMVQTGMGNFADRTIQKLHYKYLDRFNAVWVPDVPSPFGLAGILSHPALLPHATQYIGLLSRFAKTDAGSRPSADDLRITTNDALLILLSGPEPQRTELAKMLWQQLQEYSGQVTFIEGSDNAERPSCIPPNINWHKRLAANALTPLLRNASMVICRSGYSTLMDLVALNKKAILIPTPGQTEQQFLARSLHDAGIFLSVQQNKFQLKSALTDAIIFPFQPVSLHQPFDQYKTVLKNWIDQL